MINAEELVNDMQIVTNNLEVKWKDYYGMPLNYDLSDKDIDTIGDSIKAFLKNNRDR